MIKLTDVRTAVAAILVVCSTMAVGDDKAASDSKAAKAKNVYDRISGDTELATIVFDKVPGNVSAMSLLGVSADQTIIAQNPRNITAAIASADGNTTYGLSLTPAKTSILPMNVSTYDDSPIAQIWANTTFGYAQNRTEVENKKYDRRAWGIELSWYYEPEKDDPYIRYWRAVSKAGDKFRKAYESPVDAAAAAAAEADDCMLLMPSEVEEVKNAKAPKGPVVRAKLGSTVIINPDGSKTARTVIDTKDGSQTISTVITNTDGSQTIVEGDVAPMTVLADDAKYTIESNRRAAACRKQAVDSARWNASRVWGSWTDGDYKAVEGDSDRRSLGRVAVLGVTKGLNIDQFNPKKPIATAFSAVVKRTDDSPTLKTFGDASPIRQSSTLTVLRGAVEASERLRAVAEFSNTGNKEPTAANRLYKQAIGLDWKVSDGMWLIYRTGKQRKEDGTGDETGSSVNISFSPSSTLAF